ncbi:hypothetical protein M2451_001776 [Dysgonomonas sp. PFB1-18]|uniref:hypothetical protein n=1 Tax=unclassified Dysgonomonas TaxID=2630389 RepID=UPI0024748D46|nr:MULTISPECIES: hypothetical protein [unclassified Dysgonomonas]MDH6309205.1 hypothetical protein [Dysgonomonas sp. PF1-14]MDH6338915.1 hypothetical protein [Dysgonomonas sp. PF1-16]MDH6380454.1 hypothetical protein [Dysgonomonas sp. PFB1-18]MDH6397743.1 hypothetical protein [Dysgonomonas sp. PF1-23]
MENLKERIFSNPQNERILSFLSLEKSDRLQLWDDFGFDEGARVFFDKYGQNIPNDCKYSFSIHNLYLNSENGLIFAFQIGRFTFAFRYPFRDNKNRQKSYTLDDWINIEQLGNDWALLDYFYKEEQIYLEKSYSIYGG